MQPFLPTSRLVGAHYNSHMTQTPLPSLSAKAATADTADTAGTAGKAQHFLRHIIESDLASGKLAGRLLAGRADPAQVRLRFPPEPNGYLHIGHVKSICLNFGLAADYGGVCHLRLDDTNPEKEEQVYVDAIQDAVRWLGFDWHAFGVSHLYYASDYFDTMYACAEYLVQQGLAYVDEQNAEEMRRNRGDFATAGTHSPWRDRPVDENMARLRAMRAGAVPEGKAVLRAKIDMAHPNINMRDPALYRIRFATHHNTGATWCIYPMYTFAHPIEDAIEHITHSICTLEFEGQRPFYDWLLAHLAAGGLIAQPVPRQYEFARLNLGHVVTSKRKLAQLVQERHVSGWDDPRLPTVAGLRRRGYTPQALRLFAQRTGVSKSDGWIDYSVLEGALREDLELRANRAMAVLDPLALEIENWSQVFGSASTDACLAPLSPHGGEHGGQRALRFGARLWIERSDFMETPSKGYQRCYPGNRVRLKYAHVLECTGCRKNDRGEIIAVLAKVLPDTKSGTVGASAIKVKGVITWLSVEDAVPAEIRLYDRLFSVAMPGSGDSDFLQHINPQSLSVLQAYVEPAALLASSAMPLQFERHGYYIPDCIDHSSAHPVFNRAVSLKDSWGKANAN